MTCAESIRNGFSKFATFSGRASRSEFWWWTLFSTLIYLPVSAVDTLLGFGSGYGPFNVFTMVFLLVPSVAIAFRRMHDINRSGWWVALCLLLVIASVPLLLLGLATTLFNKGGFYLLLLGLVVLLVGTVPLSIGMAKSGTKGPNRFGADPLEQNTPSA